jgi:hypothetical protein
VNVAAKCRIEKDAFPERYCPKCLWRVATRAGRKPCPKHMQAEIEASLVESQEEAKCSR